MIFGGMVVVVMLQHLPEVVWQPLPLVLRIWHAPQFQNPFWAPGPLGTQPPVLLILKRLWF